MTVKLEQFEKLLRSNGLFCTKPRLHLFMSLQKYNEVTISELINLLNVHDQATVYRNIKLFEKLGIINRLRLGWHSKLELSDIFHHHHHHFTCLKCGEIIILKENQALEQEITRISNQLDFQASDHQIEIRGYCKKCIVS